MASMTTRTSPILTVCPGVTFISEIIPGIGEHISDTFSCRLAAADGARDFFVLSLPAAIGATSV